MIRTKFETENTKLRDELINIKKELIKKNKKIEENEINRIGNEFLKLNLLYGHKCRRTFFQPALFSISSAEYKQCVFKKGIIKKN